MTPIQTELLDLARNANINPTDKSSLAAAVSTFGSEATIKAIVAQNLGLDSTQSANLAANTFEAGVNLLNTETSNLLARQRLLKPLRARVSARYNPR